MPTLSAMESDKTEPTERWVLFFVSPLIVMLTKLKTEILYITMVQVFGVGSCRITFYRPLASDTIEILPTIISEKFAQILALSDERDTIKVSETM